MFVLGVQGDIAGMDVKGTDPCIAAATLFCRDKCDWLATVSGRIGAVILDRGLIYAKGDGAWLHSTNSTNLGSLSINGVNVFGPFAGAQVTNASFDQGGWLLGFGTEWTITRNWTAFVEYDYMEFDKKNVAFRSTLAHRSGCCDGQFGHQEHAVDRQGRRELQVRLGRPRRRQVTDRASY